MLVLPQNVTTVCCAIIHAKVPLSLTQLHKCVTRCSTTADIAGSANWHPTLLRDYVVKKLFVEANWIPGSRPFSVYPQWPVTLKPLWGHLLFFSSGQSLQSNSRLGLAYKDTSMYASDPYPASSTPSLTQSLRLCNTHHCVMGSEDRHHSFFIILKNERGHQKSCDKLPLFRTLKQASRGFPS